MSYAMAVVLVVLRLLGLVTSDIMGGFMNVLTAILLAGFGVPTMPGDFRGAGEEKHDIQTTDGDSFGGKDGSWQT